MSKKITLFKRPRFRQNNIDIYWILSAKTEVSETVNQV